MKNLIKENNSLKKNEKLLLEQLNAIKNEIKELNGIIQEKDEKKCISDVVKTSWHSSNRRKQTIKQFTIM